MKTPISFDDVKPENLRQVVLPLEMAQIKEFFENKDLFFLADYANSKIHGNMFLTYLSNLSFPSEIRLEGASTEQKIELLRVYMETRNLHESDVLRRTAASIVLRFKGVTPEALAEFNENSELTPEEEEEFLRRHGELAARWESFLSSSILYLGRCYPELDPEGGLARAYPVVEDPAYVGANVVLLYGLPAFVETFFSTAPRAPIRYFKAQFEEYMFRGKNLFHYFDTDFNPLLAATSGLLTGAIPYESLRDFLRSEVD